MIKCIVSVEDIEYPKGDYHQYHDKQSQQTEWRELAGGQRLETPIEPNFRLLQPKWFESCFISFYSCLSLFCHGWACLLRLSFFLVR